MKVKRSQELRAVLRIGVGINRGRSGQVCSGNFAHAREIAMSGEITTAVLEKAESQAVMIPAYTFTARVLHWTTAFLILLMIPLGHRHRE
jgi:hypothetical protein